MPKDSSARCYKKNKEKNQKSLVKDIKILLKKKKTKTENMVMNDQNLSETEKQRLLEYRKKSYDK